MGPLDIHALAGQILVAAQEIAGRVKEVDGEIAALQGKIAALERLPLTREDYLAQVRRYIRTAGEAHKGVLAADFRKVDKTVHATKRNDLPVDIFTAGRSLRGEPVTQLALCFFFEDALVEGIAKATEDLPWSTGEDALSLAEIGQRIADAQGQIETLLSERAELVSALNAYQIEGA